MSSESDEARAASLAVARAEWARRMTRTWEITSEQISALRDLQARYLEAKADRTGDGSAERIAREQRDRAAGAMLSALLITVQRLRDVDRAALEHKEI